MTIPTRDLRLVVPIMACLFASGCAQDSTPQPPTIYYGQGECDECRMIISDERFAAATVFDDGGRLTSVAFDDIGCLLAYERAHADRRIAARFVHDMNSRQWIDAASAIYVRNASIETPMASGIAAFSAKSQAEGLQSTTHGRLLNFAELGKPVASDDVVDGAATHPSLPDAHSVERGGL